MQNTPYLYIRRCFFMHQSRDILIATALKHEGDWDKILSSMQNGEMPEKTYFDKIEHLKCKVVTMLDSEYPQQLKNVHKPPIVLFYYGDLSLISEYRKNISVVGSRNYSEYGFKMTTDIVSGLIPYGFTIISGMAVGIDSIAHQTAINAGGKTVAVLGSGIDYCYPTRNLGLYKKLKKDHLVISEYPFNKEPTPSSFPIRNRIIAGLSKTLLVTEAGQHSGSLVTALLALGTNTDVMCVPYQAGINSECNRLIMNGAMLIESADDVLNQMSTF